MDRRKFLKVSSVAAGAAALPSMASAQAKSGIFDLTIEGVDSEMIDGVFVFSMMFFDRSAQGRPILEVTEGDIVTINVTNLDTRPHGFAIPGIPTASVASIPPGGKATVRFTAPVGGTYMYIDPMLAPLHRILGLYGAFIVHPKLGTTVAGSPTPYSRSTHTPQVAALFNALGVHKRFPGNKWVPRDVERDKLWLFSQVDPLIAARFDAGEVIPPASVVPTFLPRYFTINGLSGYDTAPHKTDATTDWSKGSGRIMAHGREGQPTLIRNMNAGLCTHSPHIHGNHVFKLSDIRADGTVVLNTNCYELDAWPMEPMSRRDALLPFERPRDTPVWPPKEEPFPMRYVMHCHTEMSQTAGGGNYPQGMVTHWEMTGPLGSV
ncbi:Twin-arginine translocation pathway, signal sequence, bacterial/archaeal [Sphingomonadaceae bacterium]